MNDDPLVVIDESLIVNDDFLVVNDDPLVVIDESLIVNDDFLVMNDDPSVVIDESLIVNDDFLVMNDDPSVVIDDSLIVNDDFLVVNDDFREMAPRSPGNAPKQPSQGHETRQRIRFLHRYLLKLEPPLQLQPDATPIFRADGRTLPWPSIAECHPERTASGAIREVSKDRAVPATGNR